MLEVWVDKVILVVVTFAILRSLAEGACMLMRWAYERVRIAQGKQEGFEHEPGQGVL